MKGKKWIFFGRFRLVYKRTSPLTKCVVLVAIVLSTVALIAIRSGIKSNQQEQAQLEQQAAQLEYENYQLTRQIAQIGSVESVKNIARTQLGLVDPNDEFYGTGNEK